MRGLSRAQVIHRTRQATLGLASCLSQTTTDYPRLSVRLRPHAFGGGDALPFVHQPKEKHMPVELSVMITLKNKDQWRTEATYALQDLSVVIEGGEDRLPFMESAESTFFTYKYSAQEIK